MADLLQHGQHPDADQLNAFVEKVLPEHEQLTMLAHLAGCEACREIVFLAQRDLLPEAPIVTEQQSGPWWRAWWRPVLVAGTTFACVALLVVAVQRQRNVQNQPVYDTAKPATNSPSPSLESHLERAPAETQADAALAAKKLQRRAFSAQDPSRRTSPPQAGSVPRDAASGVAGGLLGGIGTGREDAAGQPSAASPLPQTTLKMRQQFAASASAPALTNGTQVSRFVSTGGPLHLSIEPGQGDNNGLSILRGTVRDPAGAFIPMATIHLRGLSGQANTSATTDAAGGFTLAALPPGEYEIQVASTGFQSVTQRINLQAKDLAQVSPVLPVGSASQSVNVTAMPPLMQTDSVEIASTIKKSPENTFVSQATANGTLLAFDPNGTLFHKGPGDKTWKKVKPKWHGAVVKLSVNPDSKSGDQAGVPVSFLIATSSGESWTSRDGRHWKRP